jgi:hypothetical protein
MLSLMGTVVRFCEGVLARGGCEPVTRAGSRIRANKEGTWDMSGPNPYMDTKVKARTPEFPT